ncbi:MAG: hypothetical protein ACREGD_01215 [Candidatus Saccharimonadales bacterium]
MAKQQAIKKTDKQKPVKADSRIEALRKWNLWMGLLLALQALAIIIIGTQRSYPVTTNYLAVDTLASEASGGQSLAVATRHLLDLPFAWVVGVVLLVFAAGYLLAWWRRKWYEERLGLGLNDLRWLTFGVGGGLLFAVVGLLSGVYEVAMLLALVAFMAAGCLGVMAAGIIRRQAGDIATPVSHLVCSVGTACIAAPLVILAIVAGGAWLYGGTIPGFVQAIYAVVVLFVAAIGLVTHFRIVNRGRWADPVLVERAFMALGFLGVSLVAWQMFAGALLP